MKLGFVSSGLRGLSFEEGLDFLVALGVEAIEIGCAGYHTDLTYGDPEALLASQRALVAWQDALRASDLQVSALAVHGQPLHPDRRQATAYADQFGRACRLAERIGVDRITLLAGLPEAGPDDCQSNWIVVPFPPANEAAYRWQWEERVLPYWTRQARVAADHGCSLCFEMHPGDVVFNPATLLRLRAEVGPTVGCNFDPSHLVWQGIDPLEAMRALAASIYHVHAKDVEVRPERVRMDGLLDPKAFTQFASRPWSFRTVGFGHDDLFWRRFVSELRAIGYDGVISIEHEDLYFGSQPAIRAAVDLLRPIVQATQNGEEE
jgi:sugar phosphate isomerase/epimerase